MTGHDVSSMQRPPRSAVFTTLRFSKERGLFLFDQHSIRFQEHAKRLRINLPSEWKENVLSQVVALDPEIQNGLVRIEYTSEGSWNISSRAYSTRNEACDAITVSAKIWPKRIAGTKHAAWDAYNEAKQQAENSGVDVALFVHEFAVIDADRGSPILLDEDGTVWYSSSSQAVDGITLHSILSELKSSGFPVQTGKLNERMVARCIECVVLGSGLGASTIESIDGEEIGDGTTRLTDLCRNAITRLEENPTSWTGVE
ncbi:MAG: hypothetical protein DWC00_04950 [Candidatus Poseidoniales archaeon]|nr:MAG: hypothetical protein DWC00_04950 [Candidatus Poseidoniales archaeon]